MYTIMSHQFLFWGVLDFKVAFFQHSGEGVFEFLPQAKIRRENVPLDDNIKHLPYIDGYEI